MPDGIRKIEGKLVTRWEASIDVGRDPATGERRRKAKRFATEEEAKRWRAAQQVRVWSGTYVEETDETVVTFLTRWRETGTHLSPSTQRRYRYAIRRWLPLIGALPLQKLRPDHLEHALAQLSQTYANATVRADWTIIDAALKTAVRWELLLRNPADVVKAPRAVKVTRNFWTAAQVRTFLSGTQDDDLSAAYHLASLSGLRRGEILALHWSDIDLTQGTVTIQYGRTLDRDERDTIGETKTDSSRRVVGLPPSTIAALVACRDRQRIRRKAAEDAWVEMDLVIDRGDGGPFALGTFDRRFHAALRRLGLPVIRFHDLRHIAGSFALTSVRLPTIVVSRMLGHSSITTTADIYGYVETQQQIEAARLIEQAIWGQTG